MLYPNSYASVCISNVVANLFETAPPAPVPGRASFVDRVASFFRLS
jgi:hypothetical protein